LRSTKPLSAKALFRRQRVVSDLRETLVKLFGFIPEAWKKKVNSAITTQCPDPQHPWNLYYACFVGRSIDNARCHGQFQTLPRSRSLCSLRIMIVW